MSESLLEVRGLVVRYGSTVALDGVSIEVRAGEAVALIGANGSGKSTLVKAIMGVVRASAGAIAFAGRLVGQMPPWARARLGLGYVPEGRHIFPGMTVRENLTAAAREAHGPAAERVADVYRLFPDLGPHDRRAAWQLSGGQQQMLAIGRALMMRPRLLVLDEPSLGLSPVLAREVFSRVREVTAAGGSALVADQNMIGALSIAQRGYLLEAGRVAAQGTAAALREAPQVAASLPGA